MRIRNILYSVAVATLLGGCANQALADETPVGAEAPAAVPSASPSAHATSPTSRAASLSGWIEPDSYKFTLTSSCGSPVGRYKSTVVDGMVTKTEGLDADARQALMLRLSRLVPTLGQLEARAETAKNQGTLGVAVVSDPADGHPTSIIIGNHECYQISDYSVG